MVRETRHLWVGNLPESVREEKIIEHFNRYGRVESVKILPKRGSDGGVAAFVDFVDIKSAQKAHEAENTMGDRDLRTDYNEPGTIPSAARGLDDTVSIASRTREVSGFRGGAGGPTYGPPTSLHAREGRYERRLDGASGNRERAYEHSAYGHHERGTGGFDRTRHYDQDYYSRDPRERTLQHGIYYTSRSRSPTRFDAHDPRYETRTREQFTLPSVVHRDIYRDNLTREVRGRRADRNYQQSRSRSPHSSQSRTQSPQRLAGQTRPVRSPSGSGSRSRSSSSDSVSSSGSTSSDSSDSSSSSSDESPARSVQSTAVPAPPPLPLPPLDKDEPRKSFGVKVQNLPVRSTDTSLKDGLFHEFKKYGKVTSVQIHGVSEERYGLVFFRQLEDQEKALISSKGKLFFGMQIEVTAWMGQETESENEFRPLDDRIDEFHPKATRTLFIGNLEKTTTYHDLRLLFQRFGEIVDIDIKKVNGVPNYAFLQYCDIKSVCKAIKKMDGEVLGSNRLKVDFANRESQLAFYRSMDASGQDIRDFYEVLAERRGEEPRRGSYHEYTAAERTYFDTVRAAGTYPEETRREFPARTRELYADWDPYQTEYYDPRYYDDPRELRDYRDPYEQDIREYSYRQRERERERERFESDRDHDRRPLERSQSPTHSRRPKSPVTSPSQSETRLQSDPERRIYSRSSDRSESCSSLSPPRFDKPDKVRTERFIKNEKIEKELRPFDLDRTEKEKRVIKKEKQEKLEKDKMEKVKRKTKINSPSSQSSETDQENEQEPSPDKKGLGKQPLKEKIDKEGSSKNRLDLIPCVVLTRVKEKEGKVDSPTLEKLRGKYDSDSVRSPPLEQKIQLARIEPNKTDQSKTEPVRTKISKEKVLSSHVEVVDKEGKVKAKKQLKTEQTIEVANPVDLEKLEARKRRFADANLKPDRQKLDFKRSNQDEDDARLLSKKQSDGPGASREITILREVDLDRKPVRKEHPRREVKHIKSERLITVTSPKDGQESASISVGIALRPSSELQARLGEPVDVSEMQDVVKKINLTKSNQRQLQMTDDQGTERERLKEEGKKKYCRLLEEMSEHKLGQEKPHPLEMEEKLGIDIDHTQSYRKQMELSRRLKQQMEIEMAKSEKFGSPRKEVDDFDKRSLVHEVGKPPQDVTDDSPPSKKRKTDYLEFDNLTKRERNYRSSRQMSKDSERTACCPSLRHFPFHEEGDTSDFPRLLPIKDTKESPKLDEKSVSCSMIRDNVLKCTSYELGKKDQLVDVAKVKLSLTCEDDSNRWDGQVKQESCRADAPFQRCAIKNQRSRSLHDLEPGEVPTDSDEDSDNKLNSPKVSSLFDSSRFSFLLREGEEKLREREEKLSSSSERNKFYSFALDKTITPDTKALLERAKSLSSSREENWSFLDWDSRFANFRNNKDKEKVDSAPRPIPPWYMKKKKVRTDSEGKPDDKKEDHKEDEQERTELFASRFLHSSIFEQDSKRLQHLERKDEEPDIHPSRHYGKQVSSDGANIVSEFVQEPVVLFHSRFIELTRIQQKEKEKEQRTKSHEKPEENMVQPKTPESIPDSKEQEIKTPVSLGPSPLIRLPQEPAAAVLEKLTNEKNPEAPSTKDKLSELAPSTKDKLSELAPSTKDKLSELAPSTKDKHSELAPSTKDKLSELAPSTKDKLSELAPSTKDKLSELAPSTKDKLSELALSAKDKLSELAPSAKDKLSELAPSAKDKPSELAPSAKDKPSELAPSTKDKPSELAPSTKDKPSEIATSAKDLLEPTSETPVAKDQLLEITPKQEVSDSTDAQEDSTPVPEIALSISNTPPEQSESPPVEEESKSTIQMPHLSEDLIPPEHPSYLDAKPPTPGTSFAEDNSVEMEPASAPCITPPLKSIANTEEPSELKEENTLCENLDSNTSPKVEVAPEAQPPVSDHDMEVEPLVPVREKKSYKGKRSKNPVQPATATVVEKPATRKSERIDREKRNRSTSPRGDPQKLLELKVETEKAPRNASKSPSSVPDPEIIEPAVRSRRRKVKSIYATKVVDSPPLVKETIETPRPTRKRVEKEPPETVSIPTPPRRGRPPKARRKIGEEISPVKAELVKQDLGDTLPKETTEAPKPAEGWRSPRSQKMVHSQQKKGKNEQKISPNVSLDSIVDANEQAVQEPFTKECLETSEKDIDDTEPKHLKKPDDVDTAPLEGTSMEVLEQKLVTEKAGKAKGGRCRNIKTSVDQTNVRIRNVEIRLNVDEVKGALRSGEGESEQIVVSPLKVKSPLKEDMPPSFSKMDTETPFPVSPDKEIGMEPQPSPEAVQLAKQIELEQAVENIEKITENPLITAYKEPVTDVSYKEPEAEVSEVRPEEEGDKPAHQASETELLTAIGSIICDVSAEAESFPAPPTYPPDAETELPVVPAVVSSLQEEMEPGTDHSVNIINSEAPDKESSVSVSNSLSKETVESKEAEVNLSESPNNTKEAEPLQDSDIPRKEKGRPKASRPRRTRSNNKKAESVHNVVDPRIIKGRFPIKKEIKLLSEVMLKDENDIAINLPEVTEQSPSKSGLITSTEDISQDIPNENKTPTEPTAPVDPPQQSGTENEVTQSCLKKKTHLESSPITPPSAPTISVPALPSASAAKLPSAPAVGIVHHSSSVMVTDWMSRHDETRAISTPPPAMPPDTKASDIDNNSSTLRKILLEYVSPNSNTTTMVTTSISDPVSTSRLEEKLTNIPVDMMEKSEEKPAIAPISHSTTNTQISSSADNAVFTEREKVAAIITPKMTSVISRMHSSLDLDDTPRISLVKQSPQAHSPLPTMPSPKYKQRPTGNDRTCMKPAMSVIEDRSAEAGSSPGLRVSTSEGFVILSYSGQKTEGPQRISAKISQIPPASAVDIEFQQSVSKSQIKQESVAASQLPKGSQTPTDYIPSHSSLMPSSQTYSSSPVISSIKQERSSLEKTDALHVSGSNPPSQSGAVKLLSQVVNTAPVLIHNQMVHAQTVATSKKIPDSSAALKVDAKVLQPTNLSPGLSPHHSSFSGKIHTETNHINSGNSTPTDRTLPHLGVVKQEPHSPRTTGHSSPFTRTCHPSVTSSSPLTSNASVMLAQGIPVPQYISGMHPEQTVIMPPHSHLSQSDIRMSTPPLPGMTFGIRPDALHSPRAAVQPQIDVRPQQSSTPQPAPIREMVLPSLTSQHVPDDEVHYRHGVCRGSASVQSEVLVMQPEYRISSSGMRLDPYSVPRDVRLMMHSHMAAVGDHHSDTRQSRTPDGSVKTPPASKTPQPGKDMVKPPEVKMAHSPHSESRLLNVPSSNQLPGLSLPQAVVVPHGVPLIHPGGSSFHEYLPVYSDIRNYHSAAQLAHAQFPGSSPIGLPSRSMTPSQGLSEGEHAHTTQPVRSKTPQVTQELKGPPSAIGEQPHQSVNRHVGQMEQHIQHLQRTQVDTGQTSYPSPIAISIKQEIPSPHQTQAVSKQPLFVANPSLSVAPSGLSRSEPLSVIKQEPVLHAVSQRPVDMVQLLTKYPIVWQGLLALKNDTAAVQLHFVSGNNVLAHRSLPAPEGGPPLRIAQRMRLEVSQLEGVARRMMVESDYCLLLALPCGRDQEDVVNQTESLKAAFITYLQAKQAAGIINVPNPGSNQPAYVLQIFPPCEFSESHLSRLAPDLLASISNISPHLMIVIASV
ncbi:msx2-interacting protein isoform X2 [Ambystoma mexicanum]|uniref:msx2-interacting protein isoform X2 n=1 Tax=Ambystoma mexicanum TaxID=8296 RepID=UPI0037E8C6F5